MRRRHADPGRGRRRAAPRRQEPPAPCRCAGPGSSSAYFKNDGARPSPTTAGSTPATSPPSTPSGYLRLTDRAKDVIKSGGEWISTLDLEDAVCSHPAVAMAAASACRTRSGTTAAAAGRAKPAGKRHHESAMSSSSADKVAKWWLPDDVVFLDELPHTATGKLQKMKLREQFSGYRFADG